MLPLEAPATEPYTVAITPDQAAQAVDGPHPVQGPGRAGSPGDPRRAGRAALPDSDPGRVSPAQRPAASLERDLLRQLAEAGLIKILDWEAAQPGDEPRPARVAFDRAYMQAMAQVIAALHKVQIQIAPPTERPVLYERTRTITRFMHNGRLISWPAQFKQQVYVLEEVAQAFAPDRTDSEREADADSKGDLRLRSLHPTTILDRSKLLAPRAGDLQ